MTAPLPSPHTPPGYARPLTPGEKAIARLMYGDRIDLDRVELRRRKWAFFQPRGTVMAPTGHIHFHPSSRDWREDYSVAATDLRALLVHELCHVWQWQNGICLPLARHPFCRYHYSFRPGWPLKRYGIEQQAEIMRHAYLLRAGHAVPGAPPLSTYETLLTPFD